MILYTEYIHSRQNCELIVNISVVPSAKQVVENLFSFATLWKHTLNAPSRIHSFSDFAGLCFYVLMLIVVLLVFMHLYI
jgi:hypothetical protein